MRDRLDQDFAEARDDSRAWRSSGRISISGTFSKAPGEVGAAQYIYAFSRSIPRVKTARDRARLEFPRAGARSAPWRRNCRLMPSAQATVRPAGSAPLLLAGPRSREEGRRVNLLVLCGLALVVGVMTGVGAVALRALIGLFHNAFYNGTLQHLVRRQRQRGAEPVRRFRGCFRRSSAAWSSSILVQRFAPEAKGHGVPEVMDAVFYKARQHPRPGRAHQVAGVGACRSAAARRSAAKARSSRSARRWVRPSLRRSGFRPGRRSRCFRRAPAPASPRPSTRRSAACCSRWKSCCPKSRTAPFCPSSSRPAPRPRSAGC